MSVINKGAGGDPPPVTVESIMGEVNKVLEAKIGAKIDEFKKTGLGEAIKAHTEPINGQLTTINEALGKLVAGNQPPPDKGAGDGKNQVPPEINAKLSTLMDTVKNQGNTITALQTAKETARKRRIATQRFGLPSTACRSLMRRPPKPRSPSSHHMFVGWMISRSWRELMATTSRCRPLRRTTLRRSIATSSSRPAHLALVHRTIRVEFAWAQRSTQAPSRSA